MKAAYLYERGTVRYRRYTDADDVRLYRAPRGWTAEAYTLNRHPITGTPLRNGQWWIKETYLGD